MNGTEERLMLTDYHSHILPGIDDGASDAQESMAMLQESARQGVQRQVLTPHFYRHKETSVADFLQKRQLAYEKIAHQTDMPELRLGAEVAWELGISECEGIERLAIEGTRLILLEPSYYCFHRVMLQDVYHLKKLYHLMPVLAHIHRYARLYSKEQLSQLLSLDVIFQINVDAFANQKERKFAKTVLESGREWIFGSDCHHLQTRPPNMQRLEKVRGMAERLEQSNAVYERYRITGTEGN